MYLADGESSAEDSNVLLENIPFPVNHLLVFLVLLYAQIVSSALQGSLGRASSTSFKMLCEAKFNL